MTQVITRYFENAAQASMIKRTLVVERFPGRDLKVYTEPKGLVEALSAENVDPETAKAYKKKMASGGAVLLAKATYVPLGAARMTREITARMGAADMGDLTEEVYVKDPPGRTASVLSGHPHMLSRRRDPDSKTYHMADWPIPLISRRKPSDEFAIPRHGRMANFPIPLLSKRKPKDNFAFSRHARMANFPIPLLSKRKPWEGFAFPRHARMANFPIPLLSKRKPYTGSMIGRHQRMANWPFPHLINGKTGTNSLIPGAPRMANFPIPLLSKRKPADKFAFDRHARMANFPLPLLSKRKPVDKFAFPRHARMADAILPLIVRRADTETTEADAARFSFSKLFGFPTLLRR
ncbi:PucR family transcriptional regulator [Roseobacter litoralis]|uniref:PucR family transcriptional regulator n=1 Tax=Roseobacter litoralis TaxID=42443 RepID=UPI0024950E63|nr:PucR family transcriptional regulator [Roseobacter litoralis]